MLNNSYRSIAIRPAPLRIDDEHFYWQQAPSDSSGYIRKRHGDQLMFRGQTQVGYHRDVIGSQGPIYVVGVYTLDVTARTGEKKSNGNVTGKHRSNQKRPCQLPVHVCHL